MYKTLITTITALVLSTLLALEKPIVDVLTAPEPVEPIEAVKVAKTPEAKVLDRVEPAVEPKPVATPAPKPVAPSGTCSDWMAAAGIVDTANAYTLIMRESGCNPNAVNASSGACGLGQQLPCGKWPHTWNDPVGALIDMQAYVFGRYGTWLAALNHSYTFNWY